MVLLKDVDLRRVLAEEYFTSGCHAGDRSRVAAIFTPEGRLYQTSSTSNVKGEKLFAVLAGTPVHRPGSVWTIDRFIADNRSNTADVAVEWTMRQNDDGKEFIQRGSEFYTFAEDSERGLLMDEVLEERGPEARVEGRNREKQVRDGRETNRPRNLLIFHRNRCECTIRQLLGLCLKLRL